jgi:hypothetical protein
MVEKSVSVVFRQCGLAIFTMWALTSSVTAEESKQVSVTESTFKCLAELTPVRGFFVDNLLGHVDAKRRAAHSTTGGRYPPGTLIQLVPTEVMIKHRPGWNPSTNDWEFFELTVSAQGSQVRTRGVNEVKNRFGGNCFGCHVLAKPEWDLVCEKDHGCAPLPVTPERIVAIQKADPRCKADGAVPAQ